jgi:alpha-N-arabinofuranosidase
MDVDCALRGVSAKPGRAEILHDSSINAFNSFEQPDRLTVKPHEVAVESSRLRVTLPAMSIVTARVAIS